MIVTTSGSKVSLSTPTPWGEPVITKLSPRKAVDLADRLRDAAAKARETLAPTEWITHKGQEWATDGRVIIRKGTPIPDGWCGATRVPQTQFSTVFDDVVRPTDEPHLGVFDAGYASLLALGRVVMSDTPRDDNGQPNWPAIVLDTAGEVIAVVMPVAGAGPFPWPVVRADGSPWRAEPSTKPE